MNTFTEALNRKYPEKKMIIPLIGGLGNQLFQFSFGLYLNKALEIDTSYTDILLKYTRAESTTRRSLAIGSLLKIDDLNKLTAAKYLMLEAADRIFDGVIADEESIDSAFPINLTNRTRIARGYFQKYMFPDFIKDELLARISSSSEFNISRNLSPQQRICVHMRYGDYASNIQTRSFHGLTAVSYYVDQVQKLSQEFGIRSVFLVSDEADRAFQEFSKLLNRKDIKISLSAATSDQSDLSEIANSSIVITSNSSFSWWGAWFASTIHNSTIVCPEPWFADSKVFNPHLIKPDWRNAKREFT
jgi:hypothetical protein